jgi:hypothetical protein
MKVLVERNNFEILFRTEILVYVSLNGSHPHDI